MRTQLLATFTTKKDNETTIANPSKPITTFVKLVIVLDKPCNAFMLTPLLLLSIESN